MAGGLLGFFGGGADSADDPYADILTPAQRNRMQTQGLLAMAGAFAQAGMPSRLPIPFGSALGSAAAALGTGQEAGMKTAIENALAAQKVRDLRNMAEYRKKVLGDNDTLTAALQAWMGAGGTGAPPGARPAGATPPVGPYVGPGTGPGAGTPTAGAPLTMDLPYAPSGGGGLLGPGDDTGLAGPTGKGVGLLGPAPPVQRAGAAVGPVETTGSSTAPAEPDTSAGGDGWGPTFAQSRTGPARGETPEMTQLIERAAAERGVSPDVLRGLIKTESSFNPNAVSPAGAVGLAQLMPGTARELGVTNPRDPTQAIPAAASYLWQGLDAQGGDINKALMYYHGGPNQAMWGPKTQAYPGAVLAAAGGAPPPAAGDEDAGWGPTFAQGGPDRVIPSGPGAGGGLPITPAQYAPPAAGSVLAAPTGGGLLGPPAAPSGGNQAGMNAMPLLLELARRNAAAETLGLGNPYKSILDVIQGSPQFRGQIESAQEAAREPYRQTARDQELKNALTKEGWQINDKGEAVPVPLYNDVKAAQANAISTATEGPKLDSALAQQNRMRVTDSQGHVMIVPIPGGAETEARGKGLTAGAEAAAKAPYETKDVRVIGPDGQPATETMTVAEFNRRQAQRTKNAAMGAAPQPGDIISAPALSPAETKSQELGVTAGWKALESTHAAELAANRSDQQLGQIAEAMRGFTPGKTAEWRLTWGQYLKDAGFKIDGVSDGEIMQQAQRRLQLAAANVHEGSVSNYERGIFGETVTQLTNTPEGIVKAIDIQQRLNDYDRKVAAIHRDTIVNGVPNLVEAQRQIAKLGPPLSPGELSALQEIRAGKVPSPQTSPTRQWKEGDIVNYPDGSRQVVRGGQWVKIPPPGQ